MADLIDLLGEVSPSLRLGWILWLSAALVLVAWFRFARATPLPAARPPATDQVVRPPALQKTPWDLGDLPEVLPAPPSAVSEPSDEDGDRPNLTSPHHQTD